MEGRTNFVWRGREGGVDTVPRPDCDLPSQSRGMGSGKVLYGKDGDIHIVTRSHETLS